MPEPGPYPQRHHDNRVDRGEKEEGAKRIAEEHGHGNTVAGTDAGTGAATGTVTAAGTGTGTDAVTGTGTDTDADTAAAAAAAADTVTPYCASIP